VLTCSRFLWVDIQLRALKSCGQGDVERALDDLPSDLDETYSRILNNFPHNATTTSRARHVFECIAFARRPLTPAEVVEIFSINIESPSETCYEDDIADPEAYLLQKCPNLIDIVESENGGKVVQFIHFSVKEYLTSAEFKHAERPTRRYSFDNYFANITLVTICIAALDSNDLLPNLRQYAHQYWFEHVSPDAADALDELLSHFLQPNSPSFVSWTGGQSTALHWSARLGLRNHTDRLLKGSNDINLLDAEQQTPLFRAASNATFNAHFDTMRLLLEHGASCTIQPCFSHRSVLHYAIHSPKAQVAKVIGFLVQQGAQVDATMVGGHTALHEATWWGKKEAMKALIDHGANIHAFAGSQTPLHRATWCDRDVEAELLLSLGAFVDLTTGDGCTPLHFAAAFGPRATLRVLLNHDAAVDARATKRSVLGANAGDIYVYIGSTPLHLAASEGHADACQILLSHGARINNLNQDGNTLLHLTAYTRHLNVAHSPLVHRVTDRSDDANALCRARDENGRTPLHYAAEKGNTKIAHLLLEHGALLDDPDQHGKTPLDLAENAGKLDVVSFLHGYGASSRLDASSDASQMTNVDC